MKYILFYILILICMFACKTQSKFSSGVVVDLDCCQYYDTSKILEKTNFTSDDTTIYYNNKVIRQLHGVGFYSSDTNTEIRIEKKLLGYTFFDFDTKSLYFFKTFNVNAVPDSNKYNDPPMSRKYYFDKREDTFWWRRFYVDDSFKTYSNPHRLSDTIIDGVNHLRFIDTTYIDKATSNNKHIVIRFARTDIKSSPYHIALDFDSKYKCTVVWTQSSGSKPHVWLVMNKKYLNIPLTKQQIEVFEAWSKYVKEHPAE